MSKPAPNATEAPATPEQAMTSYVEFIMAKRKGPATKVFKGALESANKARHLAAILDHLVNALDQAGQRGELNNNDQIQKDLKLWASAVAEKLSNTDYTAKTRFMDQIMGHDFHGPKDLTEFLLKSMFFQINKMDKDQLMHALLFVAYAGVGDNYSLLGTWEDRYNALYESNPDQFTYADIADLAYACGEMRLDLRDDFIEDICQRLEDRAKLREDITQEDAVRGLHAMAIMDCDGPKQHHERFASVAEKALALITSPNDLSDEDKRLLLIACTWFDLETTCTPPEARVQSAQNASMREHFTAYAKEPEDDGKPVKIPKKYKPVFVTLGGNKVEVSVPVEPPCYIPQINGMGAEKLGFSAAVTADFTSANPVQNPNPELKPDDIRFHIMVDEKPDMLDTTNVPTRYNISGEVVSENAGIILKGHALLESLVLAKATSAPVLHFRAGELQRLSKAKDAKLAEAFGEYTWPVFDKELRGGVFHVARKNRELLYQPA